MSPELGTQLAGYRIDGVVGRGGMGVVYRATELALDRPVALKLIAPELAHDRSFHERFLRESRLAASLDHPGILPVYAAGEAGGDLYLATRYVDGTDLRAILAEEGALPPERALALVGQVAEALDAAHQRGLVHRDVKPGNVLVDASDHCYLCDFGLTKQLGDGGTTASGLLAGSLDYLAPEQIRRGKVDGRTDAYALACVLYECLSGAPPFRRETEAQTLWAHMHEEPPRLAAHAELAAVFARGLAKEAAQRYETCAAFVDSARSALGLGPSETTVRRRRLRLGRWLVLAGAALTAAAAVAVAFALTRGAEAVQLAGDSVAVIDPGTDTIVGEIPVVGKPAGPAVGEGSVWVGNHDRNTLLEIDPRSRDVVQTIGLGVAPTDVEVGAESVWVLSDWAVLRVDPAINDVVDRVPLPRGTGPGRWSHMEVSGNAVFVCTCADGPGSVIRIDAATTSVEPVRPSPVWMIAYGEGALWALTGYELDTIERIDPKTNAVVEIGLAGIGEASGWRYRMAVGEGAVWVLAPASLWRIDSTTKRFVGGSVPLDYREDGSSVAAGNAAVWVATPDGILLHVDPDSRAVAKAIPLGPLIHPADAYDAVAVGEGSVWVAVTSFAS